MTALRSLVSRFTAHGPKPITIHCHETCNGCESIIIASDHGPYIKCLDYGYSNRKRNKHDPDTLYRDVEAFLHEASLQGGLSEAPQYLSQCSFIEHDSEASAREKVNRRDGVLKGDCWYPGPAPAGWTSSQSTPKTTQQASQSALPLIASAQEDRPNHPFGIFDDLERDERRRLLRGPKTVASGASRLPSFQSL